MGARVAAVTILIVLAAAGPAAAQSSPFAPWDGTNPFNCVEQDVGTGTDYPDPGADPFCVKFDKTNQNVTDFGIAEFTAQEPARIAAAGPKCFYFQNDEWTGSVVQGSQPELWHWQGRYFYDRAKGVGGVYVAELRIGGVPQDATPYVPPEYRPYFVEGGGGGGVFTRESRPDPGCAAKVDSEEERAAVYANVPYFGDCVAPGGKVRADKIGRAHLGVDRKMVREKVGPAQRAVGDKDIWCVLGGGMLTVRYEGGESTSIRTTTPGHSIRGVGPGDRASDLRDVDFERTGGSDRPRFSLPGRKFDRVVHAGVREGLVAWVRMAPAEN